MKDDKTTVLSIEIKEGLYHGNWSIKAKNTEGNTISAAGTMCFDVDELTEQQTLWLASYLVEAAHSWMQGSRSSPERA